MKNSRKSCRRLKSSRSSCVLENRINELPDSIIQHILSFLDAKDAIKTCVLSKRWESLWTLAPSLLFHCKTYRCEELRKFHCFVDKTLTKYACSKVKKFLIECPNFNITAEQIDSWIKFVVNHEVEELCLQGFLCLLDWPKSMYTNYSVKKTSLHGFCATGRLERFYWTSLKILSLTNSSLGNGAIRSILVGSPVIECLAFQECKFYNDGRLGIIDASASSLKELVIDKMYCNGAQPIDILAPNLLALTISGFMSQIFNLVDVSSLMEAKMDFAMDFSMRMLSYSHEKKLLKDILRSLDHVNKLKVGISYQVITSTTIRAKFPSESHKVIEVDIVSTKGYIPALSALLHCFPDVEQLTVNLMPFDYYLFRPMEFWFEAEFLRQQEHFLIWHLKSVELFGFAPGTCLNSDKILLELVKHLLCNANVLQELIIEAGAESLSSSARLDTFRKLYTQELLSFLRASEDALVMFRSHLQ